MAHAAFFHQAAGEDESGDRQQHPALRARDERRGQLLHGIAAHPQPGDASDTEREDDRHRQHDEGDENDKYGEEKHASRRFQCKESGSWGGGAIIMEIA